MYPDQQPPSQPQYSLDYLNQIAPEAPKRKGFSPKQLLILGGALVVFVIGLILAAFANSAPNVSQLSQQLAARLQTTETIVGDAQAKIKNSDLRTLNSNLKIYLTNTNRDIAEPLLASKIDVAKLDKSIVASENGEELQATLEDARLNVDYDRTYAREMSYQLEITTTQMRELYAKTKSASLKEFLDTAYKNLQPLQKQMAEFNAANG